MLRVLTDYAKDKGLGSSKIKRQMWYMFVYALQRACIGQGSLSYVFGVT